MAFVLTSAQPNLDHITDLHSAWCWMEKICSSIASMIGGHVRFLSERNAK